MKKVETSLILLFVFLLLLINGLIINTAYKAIFTFFRNIALPPYFQITTDILSVLLASLVVFTSIVIILERRDPARTLAWLLILIFLPLVGFILYLIFGRQFRKRRMTAKKRKLNEYIYPLHEAFIEDCADISQICKAKERLIRLILNNANFPVTLYNDIQVLTNGEQIFPAMLGAMKAARKHIYLETYILRQDGIGSEFFRILSEKAQEGLDVRVIYDGLGSRELQESFLHGLRQKGVKIKPFFPVRLPFLQNRINYRNHRKILIVDNALGFIGGINIGDEYLGLNPQIGHWRDTHLRINGNATCFLQRIFMQDWHFVSGQPPEQEKLCPLETKPGNKLVQITASGPDAHWESIMQVYYYAIATAEKNIFLTSPYFVPNESILTALKTASLSGVDVKVLLPANPDHKLVYWAAMSYLEELLEAGVEIYLYQKGFIHTKVVTVDSVLSIIGSANMDQRSFSLNFEVSALIYDEETTKRLEDDFWNDLKDSEQILLHTFKERPFVSRILESGIRLLSPLL